MIFSLKCRYTVDPYVVLRCCGEETITKQFNKQLDPVWNETKVRTSTVIVSPEKWLKSRPEFGLDCLNYAAFA